MSYLAVDRQQESREWFETVRACAGYQILDPEGPGDRKGAQTSRGRERRAEIPKGQDRALRSKVRLDPAVRLVAVDTDRQSSYSGRCSTRQ